MFVIFRFERSLEGCVGVVVEGNHEVLIAPTREDMETTCVICVELVDWHTCSPPHSTSPRFTQGCTSGP